MYKQRWLFGVLALIAVLGVTIFVMKLVTDRRRESAVEQLRAKTELIAPGLLAPKASITQMDAEDIPPHAPVKIEEDAEDTIAAFDRLVETWKTLDSETQYRETTEIMFIKPFDEWTEQDHRLVPVPFIVYYPPDLGSKLNIMRAR